MAFKICDVLGVKEGQEFFFADKSGTEYLHKYRIKNNELQYYYDCHHKWIKSSLNINDICELNVKIKYIKDFTYDELVILLNLPIKYKYIARDLQDNQLYAFSDYPLKNTDTHSWYTINGSFIDLPYNHIFTDINYDDEYPVKISDYVEREFENITERE